MDFIKLSCIIASEIKSEIQDSYLKIDTSVRLVESIGNDPLVQDTLIKLADKVKPVEWFNDGASFKYNFDGPFKNGLNDLRQIPIITLKDSIWFYKNQKAENLLKDPNCPIEVLRILSNDQNNNIKLAVAKHPSCPAEILEKLSDDYWDIKCVIASHQNCPVEVLEKLSNDHDSLVRSHVAQNKNCPLEVLEKLSHDKNNSVRLLALYNPNYIEP